MNRDVNLGYGDKTITLSIPDEKLIGVFEPQELPPVPNPEAALKEALSHPIGAPRLQEKAKDARSVAIVVEDVTRPVPTTLLLSGVIEELHAAGVTHEKIKVIVATGLHRALTREELDRTLGSWKGKLHIENHDPNTQSRLVKLGTTTLGTEISINRTFMEADLKILTGDVEYHQFCGYGGGAKGVYPGIADAKAIQTNHSRMDLPGTGPGRTDRNPVREEIEEVGQMAGVDYNVSVALDAAHRIVAVCAGNPVASFREATKYIDRMYMVDLPGRADLVIASPGGHPKDIDLYQSQKAIEEASLVVKPNGKVLLIARCEEGSGSKLFEEWMDEAYTTEDVIQRIKKNFVMGGHKAYQIAREVQRAAIYIYSQLPPGRVRSWMMNPLRSLREINELISKVNSVIVLPQATLTLTRLPES